LHPNSFNSVIARVLRYGKDEEIASSRKFLIPTITITRLAIVNL
jgi:hypothetical protein